ncbi:MAG: hypothetical protein WA116_01105 [Anaerolineaceae bacterium]
MDSYDDKLVYVSFYEYRPFTGCSIGRIETKRLSTAEAEIVYAEWLKKPHYAIIMYKNIVYKNKFGYECSDSISIKKHYGNNDKSPLAIQVDKNWNDMLEQVISLSTGKNISTGSAADTVIKKFFPSDYDKLSLTEKLGWQAAKLKNTRKHEIRNEIGNNDLS